MKKRFSRDRIKQRKTAGEQSSLNPAEPLGGIPSQESGQAPFPVEDGASGFEDQAEERYEAEADGELFSDSDVIQAAAGPGGTITLIVSADENGLRLDAVLAARRPEFSRSQLARQAKEGLVLLDGRPAKASAAVTAGQSVSLPAPRSPLTDLLPEPDVILDVVYEDEHLLAVNKPWGLMVHPAPGQTGPTLAGGLLARDAWLSEVGERFRPGLVHRLDKDTSGLLITAKTEPALRALADAFSRRETKKRYLAFVRGRPKHDRGIIDSPIGRHPTQRHKMAAGVAGGRPSRTIYRVLKHFPAAGVSLVLLTLVTGRTHQARVHLQSLGTPVLADPVYSRGTADLVKRFPSLEPYLTRQLLHARSLTIVHPVTGRPQTFRAPWPPDFLGLWRELLRLEK